MTEYEKEEITKYFTWIFTSNNNSVIIESFKHVMDVDKNKDEPVTCHTFVSLQ